MSTIRVTTPFKRAVVLLCLVLCYLCAPVMIYYAASCQILNKNVLFHPPSEAQDDKQVDQREVLWYQPGQQCVQIVWSGGIRAERRWCYKRSRLGPVLAPVMRPVSPQAGRDWLPKHNISWERNNGKNLLSIQWQCIKVIYFSYSWHCQKKLHQSSLINSSAV